MKPTLATLPIALAVLLTACAARDEVREEPAATPAGPEVVSLTTTEYAFEAPDSIRAGWTTLRLANLGHTPNEIAELIELPESLAHEWALRGYYGTLQHVTVRSGSGALSNLSTCDAETERFELPARAFSDQYAGPGS